MRRVIFLLFALIFASITSTVFATNAVGMRFVHPNANGFLFTTPTPVPVVAVLVGVNANYPPFEYVDANGELQGFDIDLMKAIGEAAGFKPEFVNTRWGGIFDDLASGEFDAVISAASITDERKQIVDFSDPYFNAGLVLAVEIDSDINDPEDLTNRRVAVQFGSSGEIWGAENTHAQILRYDDITLAMQALSNGDVDAVIDDAPNLILIINAHPEWAITLVNGYLTNNYYGIAVRKDIPEVLNAINDGLDSVKSTGVYRQIYVKWFGIRLVGMPNNLFLPMITSGLYPAPSAIT